MTGDPGKKNRLIAIKSKTITNSNGDASDSFTTLASVWADYRPLRMDERYVSDARHSVRVGTFRVYYRSDITPEMVIGFDGLDWKIIGIAEVGFKDELDLTAEAVY